MQGDARGKISVLVAVSAPLLLDGIVNAIRADDDFDVVANASERTQTLEQIRELPSSTPFVAIIDYELFGQGFLETVTKIKQERGGIAILALVDRTSISLLRRFLEVGVSGYLLKTVNSIEVRDAIRAACSGKAVLDLENVCDLIQCLDEAAEKQPSLRKAQHLARKEREVLKLAARGLTNKEIAQKLFISERTVQSYFGAIFRKLGVGSRTEAVVQSLRSGWIGDEDLID